MSSSADDSWSYSSKTWHGEPWHKKQESWYPQGEWRGQGGGQWNEKPFSEKGGQPWHLTMHEYMNSQPTMQGSRSTPHFPPTPKPGEFVFPLPGSRPLYPFNNGPKGAAAAVVIKGKTDLSHRRRSSVGPRSLPGHTIEVPPQIRRQACRHIHDVDGESRCSCTKYDPCLWLPSSLFNDLTFVLDAKPFAQGLLNQADIPFCKSSDFYLYIRPLTSSSLGTGRFVSYRLRETVKHQWAAEKMTMGKVPRPEKLEYDLNCVLLPLMLRFGEEYCAVKKNLDSKQELDQLHKYLGNTPKKPKQPERPKILCSCGHGSVWHSEREEIPLNMDPDDTIVVKGNTGNQGSRRDEEKDAEDKREAELEKSLDELRRERHDKASTYMSGGRLVKCSQTLRSAASSAGFASSVGFAKSPQPHPQFSKTIGFEFRSRASKMIDDSEPSPRVVRPSAVRKSVHGTLMMAQS